MGPEGTRKNVTDDPGTNIKLAGVTVSTPREKPACNAIGLPVPDSRY
jgi:hypothetical protein